MSQNWEIIHNSGVLMTLKRDEQRKHIWCPRTSFNQLLFVSLRPGEPIDDSMIEWFLADAE